MQRWLRFTRLMGLTPGHHTEAVKSRAASSSWRRKWWKADGNAR
jgi:hypothetical protein